MLNTFAFSDFTANRPPEKKNEVPKLEERL
jgi:hypothetical protein